jgi:hypothetical protein
VNANDSQPKLDKPTRPRRKSLIGLGIGVVVIIVFVAILPYLVAGTTLRNMLLSQAVARANMGARADGASFGWFSPFSITGLNLTTADGQPLIHVASVRGDRPWWRLLVSRSDLGRFQVDRPHVELIYDENSTNFAAVGGDEQKPPGDVPLFEAQVTGASFTVRRAGEEQPVTSLSGLDVSARVEQTDTGKQLVVDPVQVLDHRPLTPEMCNEGLQLAVPVLANATWVRGEVSLALDKFRVPIGQDEAAEVEGTFDLHEVETGVKNPILLRIAQLISTLLQRDLPTKVRIAEESKIRFRVRDRRVWHEGLAFGLPEVSPDLVIRTSGSVGIDESLDLIVEVPIPVDRVFDGPLAQQIGSRPLKLQVTGTLDEPDIGLPRDGNPLGELLGGLMGDGEPGEQSAADTVLGILDRVLAPDDGGGSAPAIEIGPLLERLRERREAGGGRLFPRINPPDGTDEDAGTEDGSAQQRPLRRLFQRLLEETAEGGDGAAEGSADRDDHATDSERIMDQ